MNWYHTDYGRTHKYNERQSQKNVWGNAVLSLLVGKRDVTGEKRIRERDRGYALASASTLNRMELGEPEKAANDRAHESTSGAIRDSAAPGGSVTDTDDPFVVRIS